MNRPSAQIELRGHLLDSLTLAKVLDVIQQAGGEYALEDMSVGERKEMFSRARLTVTGQDESHLSNLLEALKPYGTVGVDVPEWVRPVHGSATVHMRGDLIDGLSLARAIDTIQRLGGGFRLENLCVGKTKAEPSTATLNITAPTEVVLTQILQSLEGTVTLEESSRPHILMCPPDYFEVAYSINPWMKATDAVNVSTARAQWDALKQVIEAAGAKVSEMPAQPGLPDLVFTANAAFMFRNKAIVARYRFPERQGEEPHVVHWLTQQGFEVMTLPKNLYFEGAGDALILQDRVLAGYRTRTDIQAHNFLTAETGLPVLSLELTHSRFYHVDVCLCPLSDGSLIYAPDAFDSYGNAVIEANVPAAKRIPVTLEEASRFACNAVNILDTVILNQGSERLNAELKSRGFHVVPLDMSEFLKSGGSSKCLTLRLNPVVSAF
jgi:N-dimethylarginine dimethylaminohydrolase